MNITIRKMKETDFESLHTLLSNPDVMKYMEPPYTEEQTKEFLEYAMSDEPRVFTAEDDGKFIGYVIYGTYEEDTMELGQGIRIRTDKAADGKSGSGRKETGDRMRSGTGRYQTHC